MGVASHFSLSRSHKNCHFCPFSFYEISIHLKAFLLKMVIDILTIFKVFINPTRGLPDPFRAFSSISSEVPEY